MNLNKNTIQILKNILIYAVLSFCSLNLFSNDINTSKDIKTINSETKILVQIEYPWNGVISANEKIHFLSKKNSKEYLLLNFLSELRPANLAMGFGINFNYLRFFNIFYNSKIASGWNYNKLKFYGLAENYNNNSIKQIKTYNFSKILLENSIGLKFLVNLNFFLKGDWLDLSFSTRQIFNHNILLPKTQYQLWYYNNDQGLNRNGFVYRGIYSIRYNPPIYLSEIALDFVTIKKLYKAIPSSINLAERFWNYELNCSFLFEAFEFMDIKLSSCWASDYNYTTYDENLHFSNQILNRESPQYLYFKNISAGLIFKIRN